MVTGLKMTNERDFSINVLKQLLISPVDCLTRWVFHYKLNLSRPLLGSILWSWKIQIHNVWKKISNVSHIVKNVGKFLGHTHKKKNALWETTLTITVTMMQCTVKQSLVFVTFYTWFTFNWNRGRWYKTSIH
jgi:hypothetical protein